MSKPDHISFFAGCGGFDLAAEAVGWNNNAHVEINPFCRTILKYYWPNAQSIKNIIGTDFHAYRGRIFCVSGGFPCQPFSNAGKRAGTLDGRYLWPEYFRAIREIQPPAVVGENVTGILSMAEREVWARVDSRNKIRWENFDNYEAVYSRQEEMLVGNIIKDLESEGYGVQLFNIPAAGIGAPHRRERIWFTAYSNSIGLQRGGEHGIWAEAFQEQTKILGGNVADHSGNGRREDHGVGESRLPYKEIKNYNWKNFPTQPPVCGRDDGLPTGIHTETISREHTMDRNLVIQSALKAKRLEVDFNTGKIFSRTIRGRKGEKVELPGSNLKGYRVHSIYVDGVKKQCKAHQIVWIAANGLYDKSSLMIDHINRNRSDNRLCNLRLVNAKENRANSHRRESQFRQNEKDLMHELHQMGHMSFREIAEHFNCSKSRVHQIVSEHSGVYGITFSKWRNESIKGYGNAVQPQVVIPIFEAFEEHRIQSITI